MVITSGLSSSSNVMTVSSSCWIRPTFALLAGGVSWTSLTTDPHPPPCVVETSVTHLHVGLTESSLIAEKCVHWKIDNNSIKKCFIFLRLSVCEVVFTEVFPFKLLDAALAISSGGGEGRVKVRDPGANGLLKQGIFFVLLYSCKNLRNFVWRPDVC